MEIFLKWAELLEKYYTEILFCIWVMVFFSGYCIGMVIYFERWIQKQREYWRREA